MTLRSILLGIQYICIAGMFLETWIIFRRLKNDLHAYLLMSCISALINNIGYLLELTSTTEEGFLAALKFSYFGRIWYAFFLWLFVAELVRIRVPNSARIVLLLTHATTYLAILTIKFHNFYYTHPQFKTDGMFARMEHGNGILHHIHIAIMLFYIVCGIFWLMRAYHRETNRVVSKRLFIVTIAVYLESVFFLIQIIGIPGLTGDYDVTILGFFLGTIFMLVAILSYDLLGTGEIARDFVVDKISEGIIAVDKLGRVQYYNQPAAELFPELKEIPLRSNGKLKENSSHKPLPEAISKAMKQATSISVGDRIYLPEENELLFEGESFGKLYVLVDETDHYSYMEELKRQRRIAEEASEAKSRFLANMSHEIRTPINAVLGMDEMILRESKEKAIRGYAADIMSAGRTLVSIINDILDLSKVEAGRLEIVPVRYDLASLVNDLVNLTRDRAVKKGLSFHLDVDPQTPHMLFGDEIRIKQCAMNLLSNAIQYTESGSVTMRVSFRKMERSVAGADRFYLKITVEDTGIGLNKEDLESLFSPYMPLDERKLKGLEGTGLGMSITRQLLDLMHGELHVESEVGKGSVFSFEVEQEVSSWEPIGDYSDRFSISEGDVAVYHELFHAPDARILVVDDMEMNITVMEGLLKQTGIRIDAALSGEDALTLAATNDYDVIFIDHMMPEMDGIETLKRMRESGGKNVDTPKVCLTANAVSGARETYLEAGFTRYMSKPIDGAELESMLCELLPPEKVQRNVLTTSVRPADNTEKPRVLVVDDDESLCALVRSILEKDYDIAVSNTVEDAVKTALEIRPDLILLDLYLTDGTGFDVMQKLREDDRATGIPFLLLTGDNDSVTEEKGFKSGASDYIRKPFVPDVLKQRTKRIVDLRRYQQSIEEEVERQTSRSRRLTRDMMLALSKTVDTKDHYTDGHSRRVAAICAEIGRRMGKSDDDQIKLYEIGLLHDIGKIGIHEDIIHKNTRLSDEEFAEVKAHTVKGYEILKEITDMPKLREGARWHHERYDGSGYPDHLKGEEIPEAARIACIADCYDAMTSTRTYSVPKKQEEVRAEILRCRGKWFDPVIADVMLQMIDEDVDYRMNEHASGSDVWKRYDKLWEFRDVVITPPPSKPVPPPVIEALPVNLENIPDMDTEKGIKNCGSVEGYLSVLSVFHRTAPTKAAEIEEAFRTDNVGDYTIRVHALKSSARIIGAMELSALAEKLEKAGKERDMDTIAAQTEKLLKMYRKLDEALGAMDESGTGKPLISEAQMKEAYQTLLEITESMDYGLLEGLLKDLEKYELSIDDENNLTSIELMMTELDWEGIASLAREALNNTEIGG